MDTNKQAKLLEERYRITRCCGLCKHGNFKENQDWGTCNVLQYAHLKHSEVARDLSIHKYGRCAARFELDKEKLAKLGAFALFLKE